MPVRIPSDQHDTVVSVLREAARVNGDVEAYVEPDGQGGRRSMTFAEWDRAADGVAGHLSRLGVAKGDVVCLLLPSSIDYAVLYGGLLRLGAITSGINPRMGSGEVASIVDRAAPVLLVVDPGMGHGPDAGTAAVVTRAEARSWPEAGPLAAAGLVGPCRRGVDEWDHGPTQGSGLRSRQPGRRGAGD
jgi:acyl-CoA synthetase (AMP-forming)/AMP-acid ligase II